MPSLRPPPPSPEKTTAVLLEMCRATAVLLLLCHVLMEVCSRRRSPKSDVTYSTGRF